MHRCLWEGCKKNQLGPNGVPACAVERFGLEARQTFTLISAEVNTRDVTKGTRGIYEAGPRWTLTRFILWVVFQLCLY